MRLVDAAFHEKEGQECNPKTVFKPQIKCWLKALHLSGLNTEKTIRCWILLFKGLKLTCSWGQGWDRWQFSWASSQTPVTPKTGQHDPPVIILSDAVFRQILQNPHFCCILGLEMLAQVPVLCLKRSCKSGTIWDIKLHLGHRVFQGTPSLGHRDKDFPEKRVAVIGQQHRRGFFSSYLGSWLASPQGKSVQANLWEIPEYPQNHRSCCYEGKIQRWKNTKFKRRRVRNYINNIISTPFNLRVTHW